MKVLRSVFLSLLFLIIFSSAASAAPDLIKLVEARRGTWTGLKAAISIQFTAASGKQASCDGALVYHRLDEKVLLQCYGKKEKLVFTLKTTDREFELYLPGHRTLYKGNIFTLEDSPAIESHLRAWDLYRAFKPMVIRAENIEIQKVPPPFFRLVEKREVVPFAVSRELTVSPEGDIVSEIYYGLSGKPSVEIQRSGFQDIGAITAGVTTAYPRQIRILSYPAAEGSPRETLFEFKQADFLADLSETDFEIMLPESTRVMELEDDFS